MNVIFQVIEMVDAVWVCPMGIAQYAIPPCVAFSNERWHKTTIEVDGVLMQIKLFDRRLRCKRPRVKRRAWMKIAKNLGVTVHSVTKQHGHAILNK